MIHGRQAEQDVVAALLAGAAEGRGGVLVLRGEAGIGKSTLLRHAVAGAPGALVLSCAGVESEVAQAFSGLHQLVRPVLRHVDGLPPAQADALRGALGIADGGASEFVVSAALVALIAAVAAEGPLLLVVDDLQWLDRASAGALLFACRRLVDEPVAVLLAVRDSTVDTSDLPQVVLEGLAKPDAARLLEDRGQEWPGDAVLSATGGNPLALVELAEHDDLGPVVADFALTGTVPVGTRVRKAFLRRVLALPPSARSLLLVAAAEDTGRLDTVLGAARRLGVADDALGAAEESGLLTVVGTELRFRHPLVRSAVYADATFHRRRAAHLAIADQLGSSTDRATWHRAVAATGPDERLAEAVERGADEARRRGGEAAAVAVLRRAARLSETVDGRRRRLVTAAFVALDSGQPDVARALVGEVMVDRVPAVTLAQLNGTVELYSGDPAVAFGHLMRCGELLADDDPEEAAWTFTLASSGAFLASDMIGARTATERILDLDCSPATLRAARALLDGVITSQELWELPGDLAEHQPDGGERTWMWATVIAWLGSDQREARKLAEAAGARLRAVAATGAISELLYYQADIAYRLGLWPEGVAHAEEGVRFSHEAGQRGWTANLLAVLARFAAARGDAVACKEYAERALAIAVPLRQHAAAGMVRAALGLLALGDGDDAGAFALLAELDVQPLMTVGALTDVVEAAVRVGERDLALRHVEWFEKWAGDRVWTRERLHQCHALLSDDPEPHHLGALSTEDGRDRPFVRARTHLLYGEWLRRERRGVDARVHLRAAAELYGGLGATAWTRRAEGELRAAGGSFQRDAGTLTPQELQVAQLAAVGYSNREIGERLHLSPRTVGSHLYRVFPKLGVTSRGQLRNLDLDAQ
ncbi:AAA family ATPase [Umezawaea endophytica]|uniref:AAA family ATPase n=1 Tax=Umezawaea endophytica TaxID=1654476 RepID=UPI0027E27F90|nr:AAA family ATPase [Umezawaea endophytica]